MFNYVIVGLLLIVIAILVKLVFNLKKEDINESNITERLGKLEANIIKEQSEFKINLLKNTNDNFNSLNDKIETRLRMINDRVNERLDVNFEKTNKTFTSVLERLSKIDEAQKKIDNLSLDIVSLQSILTDKKSRGIFGEINLNHILANVFGEKNDNIYRLQYTMPNKYIADAVLFAPDPLGTVAIDSKFPLEHYQMMVDKTKSQVERSMAEKEFKKDIKKHIDDIAHKYIIDEFTSNQAIMFLPAEALFAEVNAYHQDIVSYAMKKRIWITSPTTLMSTFTVIQVLLKNMERDKYATIIHQELNKLGLEFTRYKDRWDKLTRSMDTVNKDMENIHITTDKISKRFESINQVDIKNEELLPSSNSD